MSAAAVRRTTAVANIRLVDLDRDGRLEMVLSDMRSGIVYKARLYDEPPTFVEMARLSNPAHIEPGRSRWRWPARLAGRRPGQLSAVRPRSRCCGVAPRAQGRDLRADDAQGGPRVADVEAADFDGDGRLDLAVAAFGWRRTGDLTILKNETVDYAKPSFVPHQIDKRTGSIHGIPADLNGDKKPDLITLFAQEHETVVAFLNQGGMRFDPQVIYAAPHPNWGSSGIQVVDLDKDGDLDVLMTNGDTFDDKILKPYHGIQWLENTGTFPFTEHTLATMPACSGRRRRISTGMAIWTSSRARSCHRRTWRRAACPRWCGWSRRGRACSSGTCWKRDCRRTPRWMSEISTATVTWTSSSGTSRPTRRRLRGDLRERSRAEVTYGTPMDRQRDANRRESNARDGVSPDARAT